jgi:demethylmenaquinone methyltransferase / 2-methoxy-6-polyprenyl-1,4-benzoquinol methylase
MPQGQVAWPAVVPNRIKFFLAGPVLEAANPRFPGRPHQRLANMVGKDDRRVLEICAGTGYLARLVARAHPGTEIHALDLSPEMLAVGKRRAAAEGLDRVIFVHGDAGALPFADDHFDVVMASYGLHELPTTVRAAAIAEAARVLPPSGRLLVVDLDAPLRRSRLFDAYMRAVEKPHAREVVGPGLVSAIARAGFDLVDHHPAQTRPIPFQLIEARSTAITT